MTAGRSHRILPKPVWAGALVVCKQLDNASSSGLLCCPQKDETMGKPYWKPGRPVWCEIWKNIHNDAQHEATRDECAECQRMIERHGGMPPRRMMREFYESFARPEYKIPIPPRLRKMILERDSYTCQHCGSTTDLAVDHIVPEVWGGKTIPENLQTLCRSCNCKKADKR